ncbi:hypothetical protein FQA39_LY15855 [Lamprigera yunnana]|nr:hypothetical protein FQA39_LY15855 [Lamprigera yunnana]
MAVGANEELQLTPSSLTYQMWKEPTIPIYLYVYLFNWTNSEEVIKTKWNVKPEFTECGPYVFSQHHVRVNVTWNRNATLTYRQKRIWKFIPTMSNGSLSDNLTNVNPVAAVIGNTFSSTVYPIQLLISKLLNKFNEKLYVTKSVQELLFDGYEDPILSDIASISKLAGTDFFFKKMGWFYGRNDSATYEGTFTVYTGTNDINLLGKMNLWNGLPTTAAYDSNCAIINGSSGEIYPPVHSDQVNIFLADVCSSITLNQLESEEIDGVTGIKFVGTNYTFDNGSKYPEQACYVHNNVPSGVRDLSRCQFNAPIFMSFPHFYLGDSSYTEAIKGLSPNKSKHEMSLTLEPNTGIPLQANINLQINILLKNVEGISIFKDVKSTYIPIMWFKESATIPHNYDIFIKLIIGLKFNGPYFLYCSLIIGIALLIAHLFSVCGRAIYVLQKNSTNVGTVIFLHGSGDTGEGIYNWIKQLLGPFDLPHVKFIFPTAPLRKYTPWGGLIGNTWFDRISIQLNVPEDTESINSTSIAINQLIQEEVERGVSLNNIILGGFSMGGAMALQMAYKFNPGVKGVFALSSFLNKDSGVYAYLKNNPVPQIPLLMCHGEEDDVALFEWGKTTFDKLISLNVRGKFVSLPNTHHELKENELNELFKWINDLIPQQ